MMDSLINYRCPKCRLPVYGNEEEKYEKRLPHPINICQNCKELLQRGSCVLANFDGKTISERKSYIFFVLRTKQRLI